MKPAKTISIIELLSEYSTEHKFIKWLEKIRWDKEPICPHCGGIENISKLLDSLNEPCLQACLILCNIYHADF
jgi:hypothetical protein